MTVELSDPIRPHPPQWPDSLDIEELQAGGWFPHPLRQFVLKVHSRCNLACDYCYVYELGDHTWREQPRRMTPATVGVVADRIAEHARTHQLAAVCVTLHGGEPLLAGRDFLADTVRVLRAAAPPDLRVDLRVQTNGVLLDDTFLRLFRSLDVQVGVSIDGSADAQDRHRRYANGAGSHADVARALELLGDVQYRRLFRGLLCTVDLENEPVGTYEALLTHAPPAIDFLLPHGNWTSRPPGRTPDEHHTPYADWLIAVFERWYDAPVLETRVRLFEGIVDQVLGGSSATEAVGLTPTSVVVVEADGSIEQSDMLKSAYHGAAGTGLHLARDPFDAALRMPSIAARQLGVEALSARCRGCPVMRICGGGLYPHRYRAESGFRNPSVYCPDLYRLVTHIQRRVRTDVDAVRLTAP